MIVAFIRLNGYWIPAAASGTLAGLPYSLGGPSPGERTDKKTAGLNPAYSTRNAKLSVMRSKLSARLG